MAGKSTYLPESFVAGVANKGSYGLDGFVIAGLTRLHRFRSMSPQYGTAVFHLRYTDIASFTSKRTATRHNGRLN